MTPTSPSPARNLPYRAQKNRVPEAPLLAVASRPHAGGGAGLGPRETPPEATPSLIDKRPPGCEAAMLAASLAKTPHGAISRAVAGALGASLIVNLPGSPKAVRENFAAVLPALRHALDKLQGDPADCAAVTAVR